MENIAEPLPANRLSDLGVFETRAHKDDSKESKTRVNNATRVSARDVDGFLLSERETETRARRRKPARVRSYFDQNFRGGKGRRVVVGMVLLLAKGMSRER